MPNPEQTKDPKSKAIKPGGKKGSADTAARKRAHDDEMLDEALKGSFPASDPPSVTDPDKTIDI